MTWNVFNLDGLFSPNDPCLDTVLPAAEWGAQHPQEFGQAITTVVTAPLGIPAVARAEDAIDSVRTLNNWPGGVGDQVDLNHQLGTWAGRPSLRSGLGVSATSRARSMAREYRRSNPIWSRGIMPAPMFGPHKASPPPTASAT